MTYKKHINYLSNNLSKIIYTIKTISFLDTTNLILLYNSFIYLIYHMGLKYGQIRINQILQNYVTEKSYKNY